MYKLRTMDDLIAAEYNPRCIDDASADGLASSIDRFGDISGITWNARTGRIVCGHQRVAQLRKLGAQLVDGALQVASGDRFPVRVVDWSEAEEKAANVSANNPHITGSFNDDVDSLLAEIRGSIGDNDFSTLRLDALLSVTDDEQESDNPYTDKVESPIYEPSDRCPEIGDLYDTSRTDSLLRRIEESDVQDDVRDFLVRAAQRYTSFNYGLIADYYAHSPREVQELMELAALVIVDYNKAIELGFVQLCESLSDARKSSEYDE